MAGNALITVLAFACALLQPSAAWAQQQPKSQGKQPTDNKNTAAGAEQKPATGAAAKRAADEEAIRANVALFVKAYNAGDAKGIAALFAPEGQVVTEEGEFVEGREAIEQGFADIFAETPQTQIEVFVESIRFLGPDLALEVGATRETASPEETPENHRYTVLHAKRDGKWLMVLARDTAGEPPTHHERLQPLAWLLGEWIDDGGSSVVRTSCRFSEDGNYLLQDMTLHVAGREEMRVTQRIGWDPLQNRIRSWVFDSAGGFGEGYWARVGDSWIIKSTGVRPEGTPASATSELVPTGKDGYIWRVSDRVVGDELLPALEVKIVRKPPAPAGK